MSKRRRKKRIRRFTIVILVIIILVSFGLYIVPRIKLNQNLVGFYFEDVSPTQEIGKLQTLHEYDKNHFIAHIINYPELGKKALDEKIKTIVDNFIIDYNKSYNKNTINKKDKHYQYIEYESYLAPDGLISIIFIESREINEDKIEAIKMHPYIFDIYNLELAKETNIFIGDYKKVIKDYLIDFLPKSDEYKNVLKDNFAELLIDNFEYAINNKGIVVYYDQDEITHDFEDYVDVTIPFENFKGYLNIDTTLIAKKTKYKTETDVEEYSDYSTDMYSNQMVYLYSKDSRNSEVITTLNKGTQFTSISKSNTGWTKVKYEEQTGYIPSNLLSEEIVILEGMNSVDETVYALSDVNIRSSESANSKQLATLKRGDSIKRIGVSDSGWSEVIYNDSAAYIISSYLSLNKPESIETEIKINPQRGVEQTKPMVALTFDDGPNPTNTGRILDTLEKYNAVATFFDVGNLINSYPATVQREEALGCEVGTHTYNHPNLNSLSVSQIESQMQLSNDAFVKVLGHKPSIIRAPYGNSNAQVRSTINMPFIYWTIDTLDWKTRNKDQIIAEVNKHKNLDGKIILMHGIYPSTADAVEELIPSLIESGYELVTVSELAMYKGHTLEKGVIYYSFK